MRSKDALVLVELDFPRAVKLAPAVQQRNERLAKQYQVTGYPTVILLDSKGSMIGRLSYMEGGAKTFVRELKRLLAAGAKNLPQAQASSAAEKKD